MVEVDQDKRSFLAWIGEPEHSGVGGRCHFGFYPGIQLDSVVARMGIFLGMVEFGIFWLVIHSREEKKVSEVRDSGAAEVGEAESLYVRLRVFVPGGAVVVLVIAVRTDLYGSVRHLRSRIDIPEPVRPHEDVHIIDQPSLSECSGSTLLPGNFGPNGSRPITGFAGGGDHTIGVDILPLGADPRQRSNFRGNSGNR